MNTDILHRLPAAPDQDIWPDGAPLHPAPTAEQDAIPVPDGYPLDTWADNNSDTGWLFGVHPELRAAYATITADDPRLNPDDLQARPVVAVHDRVRGRNLSLFVVQAWPQVFTEVRDHLGMSSLRHYRAGPAWGLHRARLEVAHRIVEAEEQRQALATDSRCSVCSIPYRSSISAPTTMCEPCGQIRDGLRRTFGPAALEQIDGRARLLAVFEHLAAH